MTRWIVLSLCLLTATVFAGAQDGLGGGAAENPASRNLIAVPAKAKRVALVIGNNSYPALLPDGQLYNPDLVQEGQLYNAVNDARLMEKELIALGFDVVKGENLSFSEMKAALRSFEKSIAGGSTGTFFFAGHGVMHEGRNYLIPSSIPKLDDLAALRDEALEVNELMARLVETKAEFSLLIIDACRNNPFKVADKEGRTRTLGATRGLAEIKPPDGIITIYSAGVGQEALDGPAGGNGLFTSEFVKELRKPGLHLAEVLYNVRDSVKKTAAKVKRVQTPAIYIQADKVYLNGIALPPIDPEEGAWNAAIAGNDIQDFLDYLSEYPKGRFVAEAKIRVRQLKKGEEQERQKLEAEAAETARKEEEARLRRAEEERQRSQAAETLKRDQEAAEQARQEAKRKAEAELRLKAEHNKTKTQIGDSYADNVKLLVVNGVTIPQARIDFLLKQGTEHGQPNTPELQKIIRDKLITLEVVSQEAEKKGLGKNAETVMQIEFAKQSALANAYVLDYEKSNPITDDVLKSEYDKLKVQVGDKEYKARHILVDKQEEAKDIIAKLKKGEKFDKLAEASLDPGSKGRGGELDWAPPTTYVKSFGDALTKLQKGKYTTEPVQTTFGWHVIMLDDTRTNKVPSFDEVKKNLLKHAQQQQIEKVINDLNTNSGGVTIPQARIDFLLKQSTDKGQPNTPELQKIIRDKLITLEVVSQEAVKKGLGNNAETVMQIEFAKQSALANAYVLDYKKSNPITDDMLKSEYDKLKAQVGDKEYKARHILVDKQEEAKDIIAKLKKGEKFDKLAEASKDPGSKGRGGELDWAPPTTYVKSFGDALTKLQKGKYTTEPVQTTFGWHVIMLDDTRANKAPSFEEVKKNLLQHAQQQQVEKLISDLKAKAKIVE